MNRIADDIYSWRVAYRLTQQNAADLMGVSLITWSRWEREVTRPGEDHYNTLNWLISQPPPGWVRESVARDPGQLLGDVVDVEASA